MTLLERHGEMRRDVVEAIVAPRIAQRILSRTAENSIFRGQHLIHRHPVEVGSLLSSEQRVRSPKPGLKSTSNCNASTSPPKVPELLLVGLTRFAVSAPFVPPAGR